jgi:hypothetical protein
VNRAVEFACEPEIGLEHDKWQNLRDARLQKQLQTALIISVTFI